MFLQWGVLGPEIWCKRLGGYSSTRRYYGGVPKSKAIIESDAGDLARKKQKTKGGVTSWRRSVKNVRKENSPRHLGEWYGVAVTGGRRGCREKQTTGWRGGAAAGRVRRQAGANIGRGQTWDLRGGVELHAAAYESIKLF